MSIDDLFVYGATGKVLGQPTRERVGQRIAVLEAENARLKEEIERERMRRIACGVVAMADTPESATKVRDMHSDYRSAACDDVARRVDECIQLRDEAIKLRDLLRRVRGCFRNGETPATIASELSTLMPEIKAAVEPSGNPGELEKS